MDQSLAQKILGKITVAILVIALLDLVYLNWWTLKNQNSNIKNQNVGERTVQIEASSPTPIPADTESPSPGPSPQTEVKTVETKTVVEKQTQTIVQTAQKEIFIPMGSGSIKSNSFADLAGVEVTIDTSKYSSVDSVVFEASIWVEGGNGKVTARITNVDDKNPFIESEISTTQGTPTVKTSGKIPIPSATTKVYRVQAKTDITNFAAHVDNARLKITLK
ncbi:hypothetical protein HYS90_00245 [Candidatus Curtissbacteria bacterium]|nr:hypothetical protein [Candidatus Curtissbacteria bacterium]